jgi:hypothetical protein
MNRNGSSEPTFVIHPIWEASMMVQISAARIASGRVDHNATFADVAKFSREQMDAIFENVSANMVKDPHRYET